MRFLEKLREQDASSAVAYHLEGILEAAGNVRNLMDKIGEAWGLDTESAAETITYLQVEIYSHLSYHLKELRRPLRQLEKSVYSEIKEQESALPPNPKGV